MDACGFRRRRDHEQTPVSGRNPSESSSTRAEEERGEGSLSLVEDLLGNLPFADFTPFPAMLADHLVEMILGNVDGPEPNFGLSLAGLVELGTSGEVEEIRSRLDRSAFPADLWDRPVEDEADGFEASFGEVVGRFQGADPRLILGGHESVPVPHTER